MLNEVEKDLQAVTAELVDVQDQLLAMYNLASDLRGYLEPDALLKALVDEAVHLVGAADGFAAMAAYGGAQLEGVLLHQETLRRARVELEFELARSIQADLSPAVPTGHPGVDVHAVSRPAHDVGGDFFDFTWGDDGRLVSMLGDVAGKGIPAALLVAMTRAIIRTSSRAMQGSNPGGVLGRANAELYQDFSQ